MLHRYEFLKSENKKMTQAAFWSSFDIQITFYLYKGVFVAVLQFKSSEGNKAYFIPFVTSLYLMSGRGNEFFAFSVF